jgi:hypothetical protein
MLVSGQRALMPPVQDKGVAAVLEIEERLASKAQGENNGGVIVRDATLSWTHRLEAVR